MRSACGETMPRSAPYLQRRGDTLYFRIAVPGDLYADALAGGS